MSRGLHSYLISLPLRKCNHPGERFFINYFCNFLIRINKIFKFKFFFNSEIYHKLKKGDLFN